MLLTNLARFKQFMTLSTTGVDALIPRLIAVESGLVCRFIGRTAFYGQRTAVLDGYGTSTLFLKDAPIIDVSAVSRYNAPITKSSDGVSAAGYGFDSKTLFLVSDVFPRAKRCVVVTYEYGWKDTSTFTIAGNTPVVPVGDVESLAYAVTDLGVVAANGVAFVATTSNAPAAGQYHFQADAGTYAFNAADAGTSVVATYGYVPNDVEQACIEMVASDLKLRDNIGISSKSMNGENIVFDKGNMSASVMDLLRPYRSVVPL